MCTFNNQNHILNLKHIQSFFGKNNINYLYFKINFVEPISQNVNIEIVILFIISYLNLQLHNIRVGIINITNNIGL